MRYAKIRKMDISNGEGIGISLFVQGCPFHCTNCFNNETWDFDGGKEWTTNELNTIINLLSDPNYTRLTLLGGEPLAQENLSGISELVNKVRSNLPDKKIWLYTGYTWEKLFPYVSQQDLTIPDIMRQNIIQNCDVIIDGQFVQELQDFHLKWRGSSNQKVIDVQKTLETDKHIPILYCD